MSPTYVLDASNTDVNKVRDFWVFISSFLVISCDYLLFWMTHLMFVFLILVGSIDTFVRVSDVEEKIFLMMFLKK